MREIKCETITKAVAEACIKANRELPDDLCNLISECGAKETCPLAKSIFADMHKMHDDKLACCATCLQFFRIYYIARTKHGEGLCHRLRMKREGRNFTGSLGFMTILI